MGWCWLFLIQIEFTVAQIASTIRSLLYFYLLICKILLLLHLLLFDQFLSQILIQSRIANITQLILSLLLLLDLFHLSPSIITFALSDRHRFLYKDIISLIKTYTSWYSGLISKKASSYRGQVLWISLKLNLKVCVLDYELYQLVMFGSSSLHELYLPKMIKILIILIDSPKAFLD